MEFVDDDFVAPTDDQLVAVSVLVDKQLAYERNIAKLEDQLDKAKKELRKVQEVLLPNALAEVGLSSFTLKDGRKVEIKTEVYASISEDNTSEAFAWLRENEFGAIIKNVIRTEFGKGEDAKALEAAAVLAGAGFKPEQVESVHPQTLKAFIKEQMTKGNEVPLDLFGAYIVNRAKIGR